MIFIRNVVFSSLVKRSAKVFYLNYFLLNKFSTKSIIKTIEFKTCGQLYEEFKLNNKKLYRNSPSDGLTVKVEYVDTFADKSNISSDVKTIVAIHGNPGHYKHFDDLIEYFSAKDSKVRIIIPNILDFSITRESMAFWHSNEERSQFIRDFLKAINVSTIDCLISHSVGIHPISLIWANPTELTVRSFGLFSPQYLPERFFMIVRSLAIFCRNEWGIALMDRYKPHIRAKAILPVSFTSVDEVLCFFLIQSFIRNKEFYKYLEKLKLKQIPTLVVYGERDRAIPKKDYEKFTQRLGADRRDLVIYSDTNVIEKDSERENWIKLVSFKSGGHFCYAQYSKEVNKQLAKHCLKIEI